MSSSRGPGGRGGGTQSAGTLHPPAVLDALPGRRLLLLLLLPLLLPVWGGLRAGPAPCPVLLARRSPRELTLPGYPEPRGAPRDLAAVLRAPRGWAVRLVFLDFDLGDSPGCAGDWVTVSADGNRTDAARLCGPPGSGPPEFVSAGRTLTLRFHAGPPTPRGHRGFRALYHAVPAGNPTAVLEPGANASSRSPRGCPGPRNQTQAAVACGRPVTPLAPVPPTPGPRDAEPGSFPWQALLTSVHGRAGGALLGDRWVLTAAHTLRPKNAAVGAPGRRRPRVDVYLGHADVEAMLASGPLEVRRVHVHPDYRQDEPHDFRGDLALLELRRPAPLGPHLLPVCLPAPGSPLRPGAAGYVSGFGARRGWLGMRLRASGVTVAPRDRCRAWLRGRGRPEPLAPGMLCARDPGVCRGDSGGALVVWDDSAQHWVAAGVVSWGVGCGDGYGFYTDVLSYVDWIQGVMEGRG